MSRKEKVPPKVSEVLIAAETIMKARRINGQVLDEEGNPVVGATVIIKSNTKVGTSTDGQGKFSIMANDGDELIITFIGYKTKSVDIKQQNNLRIILEPEINSMNELVVIGYGTQKKINVTGAVASMDFSDLENIPQSNTVNILSGRLPGISVVQPGGQPGDDQGDILIRGTGTLNDASPLVIIDGAMATMKDLGNLSPQEIANVSVLKDASSAAIYGARGANGVILVSTKKPANKQLRIGYNYYYGWQKATYLPHFVDSWQWMSLNNKATNSINFSQRVIDDVKNGVLTDSFNNVQWFDHLFKTAPMQNHTVSVAGGNQAIRFQGNLGYLDQDGIMLGTSAKRYNYRINVLATVHPKINAGLTTWGYLLKTHESSTPTNTLMNQANMALPVTPVRFSNGKWGVYHPAAPDGNDPARVVNNPVLFSEIGRNYEDESKVNWQGYLEFKPVKELTAAYRVTYTQGNTYRENFLPTYSYSALTDAPVLYNIRSSLLNRADNLNQLQMQTTLNYKKLFAKKHEMSFLLGHEYNSFSSRYFQGRGYDLPNNDLQVLDRAVTDFGIAGSKQLWRLQSFFGRGNYAYLNKYLLEANLRVDGSSRFSEGNKYGFFPSFSAGWILTNEEFLQGLKAAGFNTVKLRGGWGKVGNDRIGNYAFEQYLSLDNMYAIGGALNAGAAITSYGNDQLKWESTTTSNLGIDMAILKNRLNINADIFHRITDNILYNLPVPPSFGFVTPAVQNIASVSNKGWEISVSYRNQKGALKYNVGANIGYVKNRIENLNTREAIDGKFILREGQPIYSFYGYVYEGIIRDSSELNKYPAVSNNERKIGAMRFKDINNDEVINDEDRVVLGDANTPYTYGITASLSYKGVDFNLLLQGVSGKKIYIYDFGNRPGNAGNSNYWSEWWDRSFDPERNPNGDWPGMLRTAPGASASSSFWINDASYLRVKNVEIGYTIPRHLLQKARITNFRVYAAAQNLVTFSKLIKQLDPERRNTVVQNTSYPQTKLITVGVNLSL